MQEKPAPATNHILIEFIGGDADGRYLDSESEDALESELAKMVYFGTQNGTIGRGMRSMPLAWQEQLFKGQWIELRPYHPHEYRIIERLEEGNEILLRMQYKGQVVADETEQ